MLEDARRIKGQTSSPCDWSRVSSILGPVGPMLLADDAGKVFLKSTGQARSMSTTLLLITWREGATFVWLL